MIASRAVLALTIAICAACSKSPAPAPDTPSTQAQPAQAAPTGPPRSCDLPDLAAAEPSVQRQVRAQYDLLTRAQSQHAGDAEVGVASGEVGSLLLAAEYPDAAEPCFANAERLAPADARWPYYLGHLYSDKGDAARGAAAFERASRLQPNDAATLVWLGNAYLNQGRATDAEAPFQKALTIEPRSAAALFGLGRAELAARRYADAASHFEQALTISPGASVVHYPLALAYRGLGQQDKAEAQLRQRGQAEIVPRDPLMDRLDGLLESATAYEKRGVRDMGRGLWNEAATAFRKGLALAPDNASLHHQLGTALAMSGDPRGAFDHFQTAVRLSPRFAKAYYSLGVMMASSPQGVDQAVQALSTAVRYDPSYVEARAQLADVLRRSGRTADAIDQYDRVLQQEPRMGPAYAGLAAALSRARRYAEARDRLSPVVSTPGAPPEAVEALVRLLAAAPDDRVRNGQQAMMLASGLAAGQGSSPNPNAVEAIAMAYAETGQFDEAARWQSEAVAIASRGGRPDLAELMTDNLRLYQRHQPCRTPWRERA